MILLTHTQKLRIMKALLITLTMLVSSITFAQSGIYYAWLASNENEIFEAEAKCDSPTTAKEIGTTTKYEKTDFVKVEEWSSFRDDCGYIVPIREILSEGRIETWHFGGSEIKKW